ncbi:MAG TPA: hypothetical protein VF895_09505, partial [Gaiellaceae bacterium]
MAVVGSDPRAAEQILADDRAHVIHPWSVNADAAPIPVAGGEGCYFWDYEGKRYLDFASQLINLSL